MINYQSILRVQIENAYLSSMRSMSPREVCHLGVQVHSWQNAAQSLHYGRVSTVQMKTIQSNYA